jgi:hypothetical protein
MHFSYSGDILFIDPFFDDPEKFLQSLDKCNTLLSSLPQGSVVGLDFEWTPDMIPAKTANETTPSSTIGLIQISLVSICIVYRVDYRPQSPGTNILPLSISRFLNSIHLYRVFTIGFDYSDCDKLRSSFNISIRKQLFASILDAKNLLGLIDICDLAQLSKIPARGLKSISAYLGWPFRKSKKLAMSPWGDEKLEYSKEQVQYASEDAYFSALIGIKLMAGEGEDGASDELLLEWMKYLKDPVDLSEWMEIEKKQELEFYKLHEDVYETDGGCYVRKRRKLNGGEKEDCEDVKEDVITGEGILQKLSEKMIGEFVSDKEILTTLLPDKDIRDVRPSMNKMLRDRIYSIVTSEYTDQVSVSADNDRYLFRLVNHPSQTSQARIVDLVKQAIPDVDMPIIESVIDDARVVSDLEYVGRSTAKEWSVVLSVISKYKRISDRNKYGDKYVNDVNYNKKILNLFMRNIANSNTISKK